MLNTVYNLKNREITVNSRHSNSVYPHLCSQSAMRPCSLKSLKVDRVKRLSLAQFLNPLRSGRGLVATGSWQQQPFHRSCGGCSSSSSLVLVALHLFLLERKSSLEGQRGEKNRFQLRTTCTERASVPPALFPGIATLLSLASLCYAVTPHTKNARTE